MLLTSEAPLPPNRKPSTSQLEALKFEKRDLKTPVKGRFEGPANQKRANRLLRNTIFHTFPGFIGVQLSCFYSNSSKGCYRINAAQTRVYNLPLVWGQVF
jgi:hypothetical protein